jgi:hypothetical protein
VGCGVACPSNPLAAAVPSNPLPRYSVAVASHVTHIAIAIEDRGGTALLGRTICVSELSNLNG